MRLWKVGPALQGIARVFVVNIIKPLNKQSSGQKISGIDAHVMSGLWRLYKYAWE